MYRIASTVFALATAAPLAAQGTGAAQEHADKALQFVQRGDLRSAEGELRQAVEISPDDPALLSSLGGILGMEGDLKRANVYLAKAVKLDPQDVALRRNLAANQWQLGRLKEAHENLDRLLRANPQDQAATFLLGMVSERETNYARSIALLESNPGIAEHQPEALVALASSYYHTGRPQDGRLRLNALLQRPAKPEVAFMGGRVAMDAGDYALAESLFSAVRTTYRERAAVEFQIASAQLRGQHAAESEKTMLAAIQAGHAGKDIYLLLCNVLAGRAAYDRALEVARDATRAFPNSYETFSTKASIEMKLSYFAEAAASLQQAVRLHPSVEGQRQLALAEWRAGEKQKAIAQFEQTIRQFPRDAETCQTYGTLLIEDHSPESRDRGIQLLKQALAADDSSVEARYQLANIEMEAGNLQPALEYLTGALKREPDASRLHFALSRVYRRLGREADAAREIETYQKLKQAEQSRP
jgi:tetratricopeptide (TPR) repeat protein